MGVTLSLNSRLSDLIDAAAEIKSPKAVIRFDLGDGREVAVAAFVSDPNGYLRVIQAYEDSRDEFAMHTANAVAKDFRENGVPNERDVIQLIHSSRG